MSGDSYPDRLARLVREVPQDTRSAEQRRMDAWVAEQVAKAPPLSAWQRTRLRDILRAVDDLRRTR